MDMSSPPHQIELFEHVAAAYAQPTSGRLTNAELYRMAADRAGVQNETLQMTAPIGKAGKAHKTLQRTIRWHQQTLRQLGLIERVKDSRGVWELTQAGRQKLRKINDGVAVLGYSTDLGMAIWSNANTVFDKWNEPIFLGLTSLPYPLSNPRAYGNPTLEEYVDFACRIIEPIVKNLVTGGNIALSLSPDIFEPGTPALSLYLEDLTYALRTRLGLRLMNRIIWESNKPPGPIAWASKQRMQLNSAYEYVLWFCNDPLRCIADNRRILEPHTEKHKKLIAAGGEQRTAINGDGAYRIKPGSYGNPTEGRIARNIWKISNTCHSQRAYKRRAKELGLAPHGAAMPLELARKLVRFLCDIGQMVAEPCGGSGTIPLACELEGRQWVSTENVFDYVRGSAERFRGCKGFELALDVL